MNLRLSWKKDPETLAHLNRHVHEWHTSRHPDVFKPYDYTAVLDWFQKVLADENCYGLLAYAGEEPVGYALLFHKQHPDHPFLLPAYEALHIDQMAVVPSWRGRGAGTLLLEEIRTFCRKKGIERLQLSVWTDNEAARGLYRKQGFEPFLEYMECRVRS